MQRRVAALTLALLVAACSAGEPARELLNSERIEQSFGSYGVNVLVAEPGLRISSLYSTAAGVQTTRTLAVVEWRREVDPRLTGAHTAILGGASIGATFEGAGWTVAKRNLYFGEVPAPEAVSRLMRIPAGSALALHGYALSVARGDDEIDYATIAELHHPDYLDLAGLDAIYGSVQPADAGPGTSVTALVDVALARLAGLSSERPE